MTREQTLAWLMQLAESAAEELKEAVANEALMEKIFAESTSMSDDELDASLRAYGIEPIEMLERFQQIRQIYRKDAGDESVWRELSEMEAEVFSEDNSPHGARISPMQRVKGGRLQNEQTPFVVGNDSVLTTMTQLEKRVIDLAATPFRSSLEAAPLNLGDTPVSAVSGTATLSLTDYFGAERLATDLPWATASIDITRSWRADDGSLVFLARIGMNRRRACLARHNNKLEVDIVIGDQKAKTTLFPGVYYRTIGQFKPSEIQLLWLDIVEDDNEQRS